MNLNTIMVALVAELAADGVPTPLHQSFILAAVWQDLARLAGEALPPAALAVVGDALDQVCEPLPVRAPVHAAHTVGDWLPAD